MKMPPLQRLVNYFLGAAAVPEPERARRITDDHHEHPGGRGGVLSDHRRHLAVRVPSAASARCGGGD